MKLNFVNKKTSYIAMKWRNCNKKLIIPFLIKNLKKII